MKKLIWIVLAVTLFTLLPLNALAGNWEFIAEHHHKQYGGRFEAHTFRGNRCTKCGYVRGEPQPGIFNETILNNSCWVHYDCTLYNAPNGSPIAWQEKIENYYVGDYVYEGGIMWVLLKTRADSYAPLVGWVDASNIRFDPSPGHIVPGSVVGCTIVITASSGRGRQGPGTEYAYVETVRWKERYVILGQTIGSNGNTWYKIKVGSNMVWISSGLAKLI